MHGLVNRTFEDFLRRTYGRAVWDRIIAALDPGFHSFETMLVYEDKLTTDMVRIASRLLDKPAEMLLEDYGTSLVADQQSERVRRLLRFGGVDYLDFLHSLDDLPGRVRLAVPELDMPQLELGEQGGGEFTLVCRGSITGFGHVFMGILRALADDYGALVYLDYLGRRDGDETLLIRLFDDQFSDGRDFSLAASAA